MPLTKVRKIDLKPSTSRDSTPLEVRICSPHYFSELTASAVVSFQIAAAFTDL